MPTPLDHAAVAGQFDEVADAYDLQVALNPGYHQNLRRAVAAMLTRAGSTGGRATRVLDVGCGSGASTRAVLAGLDGRPATVVGVDASAGMLEQARAKRWPAGVSFHLGRAEDLESVLGGPQAGDTVPQPVRPFDAILAAYLLRNVTDRDLTLRQLYSLLRPGGVLAIHDYSVRDNPRAKALWTAVCWSVVIPLGRITGGSSDLYRYLWRSAVEFDSIPELVARVRAAGFVDVEVVPGTGWQNGILHTVVARRPDLHRPSGVAEVDPAARPGRDRRAVRHLAAPPHGSAPLRHVVVIGGGIAGLAAATGLAERGVQVTVIEREQQLGGRVRAWPHTLPDGTTTTMSRGFHAFFRQYYTLRALLRRADPALAALRPLDDYPLLLSDGTRDSFANLPTTPPLSVAAFVAASPSFTAAELAKVHVPSALDLLRVDFPATFSDYDGISAAQFLDQLRFPSRARHLSLEVFARSFFADPREFSAGELVAMFHTYFLGSAEGLLFDVPIDDYDSALWAPLGRYLSGLGVDVRTGHLVEGLSQDGSGVIIETDAGSVSADAVVLATDTVSLQRLVAGAPWLGEGDWRERVAALTAAPSFAVWRFWFDRDVAAGTPPFLGTSGFGMLDNVSVVNAFEAGAATWAARTGGSVVEVHGYAVPDDPRQVRADLWRNLLRVNPELEQAKVIDQQWLLHRDCPLISTQPWLDRPAVDTPDPRVVLAGDGIRCDLPVALMERAAVTGFQAANTLLTGAGHPGHDLWSAPMTGLLRRRPRS